MVEKDKVKELEERVSELEKQVEGASVFISSIAPLLGVLGLGAIKAGHDNTGSQFVILANQLKIPENNPKLFKGAAENKEGILALGKALEEVIKDSLY